MKNIALYILFIMMPFVLAAQNVGQKGDTVINYIDINGMKQGHWQKKYRNEKIAYDAYFKNDKLVGEYKRYYSNGQLSAYIVYDNEGNTGYAKMYWDNGKLMAEGKYVNSNVKDSIWRFYGIDEGLVAEVSYKKGIKDGPSINYFRNGNKSEIVKYKEGVKEGLWRQFYDDGNTRFETVYKNGKLNGIFHYFYKNGRLKYKGTYVNGLKHGKFYKYSTSGEITTELEYVKGLATNEDELGRQFAKEIEEADKHKDRYKEPTIEDVFKNNIKSRY